MPKHNFLTQIVQTPRFIKQLHKTKAISEETSLEAGFIITRKLRTGVYRFGLNKPYLISEVQVGDDEESIRFSNVGEGFSDGLYDVIHIHSHGKVDHFLPSPADLAAGIHEQQNLYDDAISLLPVEMILSYDTKNIYLFCYQPKKQTPIAEEEIDKFCEQYDREISKPALLKSIQPSSVVHYLNKSGLYRSTMITVKKNKIGPVDLKKLQPFSDTYFFDEARLEQRIKEDENYYMMLDKTVFEENDERAAS